MPNEPAPCEILLAARHVDSPDRARAYALAQLTPVVRAARNVRLACIEITFDDRQEEHRRYMVEVAMDGPRAALCVRERAGTAEAATDRARDLLRRSLREWNATDRLGPRRRSPQGARGAARPASAGAPTGAQPSGRTDLKPLTEEEAVRQMELFGQDLLFFLNASTGRWRVAFRRESGGYGFTDPGLLGL